MFKKKAQAKAKVEDLEIRLFKACNEACKEVASRFHRLENVLIWEKEERKRALKEQGAIHAKQEDKLAQKLKELLMALTCAVLKDMSYYLILHHMYLIKLSYRTFSLSVPSRFMQPLTRSKTCLPSILVLPVSAISPIP